MKDKPTYEELERRIEALEQEALARKRPQEALRESERLLHEMGRMAKIGGWEVDTRTFDVTWTEGDLSEFTRSLSGKCLPWKRPSSSLTRTIETG